MDTGLLIFLASSLLVAMALLAFVSRTARATCFVLGLMVGFGIDIWIRPGGHDPRAMVSMLCYCVALAAVLVEIAAFAIRTFRKGRAAEARAKESAP